MSYLEITKIITTILGVFTYIFMIEYLFICIVGICSKGKKFPVRKEKLRYAVLVGARNEDKVIGQLIDSIRKCNYPQDKIDIFIMAHNCSDKTAQVARKHLTGGGQVYEYNNPNEKTKGYALKKLLEYIERDYGKQNYDGFHIFDADNILDSEYFTKMNDAFLYYDKKHAITSFRNSKNSDENAQTASYGLLNISGCSVEANGRMTLGAWGRSIGSGFLISSEMVKDGWNIVNISDDLDFSIVQLLEGYKVMYCHDAMYYDEYPTGFKDMWRQRLRWAKGSLIVYGKYFKALFKTAFGFKKRKEGEPKRCRFSAMDCLISTLPVALIGLGSIVIDVIFKLFIPLSGVNPLPVWRNWAISIAFGILIGYLFAVLLGIICYVKERKRIPKISTKVKIASLLWWPIFSYMAAFLQLIALCSKKEFAWTVIEHKNQANFESLNTNACTVLTNTNNVRKKERGMNIVILSGGSGNDSLVKGLKKLFGDNKEFNIKVIVNAYDNGKSTGVCRAITNTLGVSDIRKNHSRMYKAVYADKVDENLMQFYNGRYAISAGGGLLKVKELLSEWKMEEYIPYAERFFALPKAKDYEFNDFSVSNIIYSQMYRELGYEKTNKHFCDKMGIDDFVVLNSFDNVFLKAQTQSGKIIEDEGETVFWNNPNDKIVKSVYDVENGNFGVNPKAVELIENADLILISTGTFWSSIQPTIEYLDFYKYINASNASKIWVMNNNEDGDSWGVTSLEFVKFMEESGLNLDDFKIIVNKDASDGLKLTDKKHNFVEKQMGNINGKHDPQLFAKSILEIYYDIDQKFDTIVLDFDDTIYSRSLAKAELEKSFDNVKRLNDKFSDKALIISGNSYQSIDAKIKNVCKDAKDFKVNVWADANSTLFMGGEMAEKLDSLELSDQALTLIDSLVKENHLEDKVSFVGKGRPVNIKIKPLTEQQRTELQKEFNSKSNGLFMANITGKTTLDIISVNNNKKVLFDKLGLAKQHTLFIGDEISAGNDAVIAKLCDKYIEVKGVGETQVVLKLLEDK